MSLDFSKDYLHINGSGDTTPQFFKKGFWINRPSSPSSGWQDVTVSGNNYVNLVNAKANGLNYLKLFGACKQSNLPDGYTQTEYTRNNNGSTYINTGFKPRVDDFEMEIKVMPSTDSWYIFQSRYSTSSGQTGILGANSGSTIGIGFNGEIGTSSISRDTTHIYTINAKYKNGTGTLYVKDETTGDEDTQTITYTFSSVLKNIGLFGNTTGQGVKAGNKIYYAWLKSEDEYVLNYIPCIYNGVSGFYDTVTSSFVGATTGAFTAEGTDVPIPTSPINIKCNNGTLKTTKTSGLPDGYTRVKALINNTSGDKTKLDTGISPNDGDIIEMRYTWSTSSNSSNYIFQARRNSQAVIYGIAGSQTGNTIGCGMNGGGVTLSNIKRKNGHTYLVRASFLDGVATLYAKDETENTEETATGTYTYGATTATFYIWGNASNTLAYVAPVDYVKITNGNTTRLHYVAATNAENTPGFYDLVNNQFISTMTIGDVTAGDIATDPAIIYTDGTTETVQSKDGNNTVLSTATAENLLALNTYIDVQSVIDGDVKRNVGIKVFDGSENWVQYPSSTTYYIDDLITDNKFSIAANILLCTHYAPTLGNPLPDDTLRFQMDKYQKVSSHRLYIADSINSTLEEWKAWLAQQYAAGTPVMVLYPLATETTETVSGQSMKIARGSNTIEITQASINPLSLEAQYKAGVEVTVQEVEDANLDNNVTVVIED